MLAITRSVQWLEKGIGELLSEAENNLHRLNWFSGEIEYIEPSNNLFIPSKLNSVDGLIIEVLISDQNL